MSSIDKLAKIFKQEINQQLKQQKKQIVVMDFEELTKIVFRPRAEITTFFEWLVCVRPNCPTLEEEKNTRIEEIKEAILKSLEVWKDNPIKEYLEGESVSLQKMLEGSIRNGDCPNDYERLEIINSKLNLHRKEIKWIT